MGGFVGPTLPAVTSAEVNDVLTIVAGPEIAWEAGGGGAVSSVFTRTGAVVADTGDYTAAQVGALPSSMVTYLTPSGDVSGATDTAAINSAVAADKTIFLAPGVYYTDATITLASGCKLIGSGCGQIYNASTSNVTIIRYASAAATYHLITVPNDTNTAGVIQDIQLYGLGNTGAYNGIEFADSSSFYQCEWVISRCFIWDFAGGVGIYFGGQNGGLYCHQTTIYDCMIGLTLTGSDAVIDTCAILHNTSYGIQVSGTLQTIINCSIGGNGYGIYVATGITAPGIVANNGINLSTYSGIYIGSGGLIVRGNSIHTNSQTADNTYADITIANYGSDPAIISDNYFWYDNTGKKATYNIDFVGVQKAVGCNNVASATSSHSGFANVPAQFVMAVSSTNPLYTEAGNELDDGSGDGVMVVPGAVYAGTVQAQVVETTSKFVWSGNGSDLYSNSGAPTISGAAGDFYFRTDTPTTALQRLYVCTGGTSWTAIL